MHPLHPIVLNVRMTTPFVGQLKVFSVNYLCMVGKRGLTTDVELWVKYCQNLACFGGSFKVLP